MQANKPLWDAKKVTGDQYLNKSYVLVTVDAKAKVAKTLAGELLKVVLKFTGTTPEDVIGFAESWSAIIDDCTNKTTNKEVLKKIETNIQEKSVSDADDDISDSNEQAVA